MLDGEDHDDRDRSGRRVEDGFPPVRKARPRPTTRKPRFHTACDQDAGDHLRRPAPQDVAAPRAMRSSLGRRVLCLGSFSVMPWSTLLDHVVDLLPPFSETDSSGADLVHGPWCTHPGRLQSLHNERDIRPGQDHETARFERDAPGGGWHGGNRRPSRSCRGLPPSARSSALIGTGPDSSMSPLVRHALGGLRQVVGEQHSTFGGARPRRPSRRRHHRHGVFANWASECSSTLASSVA